MKRTRKRPYYYLTSLGTISYTVDNRSDEDTSSRFKIGNYFDEDGAREAQKRFLSILKPKGVINKIKAYIR